MDASLLEDPEAFSETWTNERITEWFNAGATPENAQKAYDSNISVSDYAKELAAKYDDLYIEALLVEDWESKPEMVIWVNNMKNIHALTLHLYMVTSWPDRNPDDKVPYFRGSKIVEMKSWYVKDDGNIFVTSMELDYDNSDDNRVGEQITNNVEAIPKNYEPGQVMRVFTIIDGKVKLSDIMLYHR